MTTETEATTRLIKQVAKHMLECPAISKCGPTDREVENAWNILKSKIGKRYEHCRIHNYRIENDKQRKVVADLKFYCENMQERVEAGRGMVLYGPPGTGKDHLMVGALGRAIKLRFSVEWIDGLNLHDLFYQKFRQNSGDTDLLNPLRSVKVLAISDPLPVDSELPPSIKSQLRGLIDHRYRNMKPTWTTVNVATREEADVRFGQSTFDRLLDGAMTGFFDWPSHRCSSKSNKSAAGAA